MNIFKLKDVNVLDINIESETETVYGGYCETCYYEEEIITGGVVFILEGGEKHTFINISIGNYDDLSIETLIGFSIGDMMKVFLNKSFLNTLEETPLSEFNKVLAVAIWEQANSDGKSRISRLFEEEIDEHVTEMMKNEK